MGNDFADARIKRLGYPGSKSTMTVSQDFAKIGDRSIREFNFRARRKDLSTASTSASVATPLRSASSIACNSSGVA
jgi:hypothetical protein